MVFLVKLPIGLPLDISPSEELSITIGLSADPVTTMASTALLSFAFSRNLVVSRDSFSAALFVGPLGIFTYRSSERIIIFGF